MSTVLYLANQQLQVVTGSSGSKKVSVSKTYRAEAPEGSIINGIIMDSESFIEFIKGFWKENKLSTKDVTLVINSSKFIGKTLELPPLKDSKTIEFIDREFADIKRDDDVVYGYIPLAGADAKMRKVYAEAIAADFIGDYIEIFKEAGISIKEIISGESSLISLTDMTVAKSYQTFVMIIADPITLTTLLWVDKCFYYFNSVRCFHDQGTEEHAMDVARSISQIMQFMKANQIEHVLQNIQLAGIPDPDIRMYRDALEQQGIVVPIDVFDARQLSSGSEDVQDALHATSGLIENGKYHNFLSQYRNKNKREKKQGSGRKGLLLVGAFFAVMVMATVVAYGLRLIKQAEYNASDEAVNSPVVVQQLAEYDMLLQRNSFLYRQFNAINDIDENIAGYPLCDDAIINKIKKCAGSFATVEFESFDAEAGKVTVVAKADDVDNINKFIKELNGETIFNNIDYTGYSYEETTNLWDIHVTCTLSEGAGR